MKKPLYMDEESINVKNFYQIVIKKLYFCIDYYVKTSYNVYTSICDRLILMRISSRMYII